MHITINSPQRKILQSLLSGYVSTQQKRSRSKSLKKIAMEFKVIPEKRFDEVVQSLRDSFFMDEPLNKAVKLCEKGQGHEGLERFTHKTLAENLSIMAVTKEEEIAGVVLGGTLRPGDIEKSLKEVQEMKDEKFKKILTAIYSSNLKCRLFEKYKVSKMFDVRILSVSSKFQGQGLAKKLMNECLALAKKSGYKIAKTDATGLFSQKIMKSAGFKPIHELNYAKYVDQSGKQILPVEAPHVKLEILVRYLNC